MDCPRLKLNNGREVPQIGLGTWKSKPGEVKQAVINAIKAGYRHIDCAMSYDNEYEVGAALKECIPSIVKREDIFVTSKLWVNDYDEVEDALKISLHKLGLEYLDLYLMHWPIFEKLKVKRDPKDTDHWFKGVGAECEILTYDKGWINKVWGDLEKCVEKGLVKSIGVSNYTGSKIAKILEFAKIPPAMNQIEIHPSLSNEETIKYCQSKGIQVTAYSPLGSIDRPANLVQESHPVPINDPVIIEIAKTHSKSPAQIILRWDIQRGICAIPKSVSKSRIEENINIFDFKLSDEEMNKINGLNRNSRIFDGMHHLHDEAAVVELWK